MLLPPTEIILIGAAFALYLYDSVVLLFANEAVVFPIRGSKWRLKFGSARFQWRGQEILLPNPLTPHRPLYRLTWAGAMGGASRSPAPPPPDYDFGRLPVLVWMMTLALFVFLPLGLFTRLGDLFIVATLVTFYGAAFTAMWLLWSQRQRFHCDNKQFAHLAFESLTCPPFALNLIRHLSLGCTQTTDLVAAACAWQTADDWNETRTALVERLQDDMQWLGENTKEVAVLRGSMERLLGADIDTPQASESPKTMSNPTLPAEARGSRKDDGS